MRTLRVDERCWKLWCLTFVDVGKAVRLLDGDATKKKLPHVEEVWGKAGGITLRNSYFS